MEDNHNIWLRGQWMTPEDMEHYTHKWSIEESYVTAPYMMEEIGSSGQPSMTIHMASSSSSSTQARNDNHIRQCLVEGCRNVATSRSTVPLCAQCDLFMKQTGTVKIKLMNVTGSQAAAWSQDRPNRRANAGRQYSTCRCPCGRSGSLDDSDDDSLSEDDMPSTSIDIR